MHLEGRTVLVTGASSGIGHALAQAFDAKGCRQALLARDAAALGRVAADLNHPALVLPCDVTRDAEVKDAVAEALGVLGPIDVLVNNAGCGVYGPLERTPLPVAVRVFDVNFFGSLRVLQAVLPAMRRAGGGLVVNVCSAAATHGVPYLGAYGASKAALASLGQSLRAELAGTGVRVAEVFPGYVDTAFFARETRTGGARRPALPYLPARVAADAVVRGIETDRTRIRFPAESVLLRVLEALSPGAVDLAMARAARALREGGAQP
jgi:short-subunit dehydrogenase